MNIDHQVYEMVSKNLNSESVIIDIGAYTGKIANDLIKKTNTNKKNYYLIEACPNNFKQLKKNCGECKLYNIAIGDKTGKIDFYIGNHKKSEGSSQANSLYKFFIEGKEWNKKTKKIEIDSYILDDFIKINKISDIDFIKINCEGGEYKIFSSLTLDFLEKTKYIYLQLHGKDKNFITDDMVKLKLKINDEIIKRNFELVLGDNYADIPKIKDHIHQLWKKKC